MFFLFFCNFWDKLNYCRWSISGVFAVNSQQSSYHFLTLYHILHYTKQWNFPLRISSLNVTKFVYSCKFGHIYWKNLWWKTSFFFNVKDCTCSIACCRLTVITALPYTSFSRKTKLGNWNFSLCLWSLCHQHIREYIDIEQQKIFTCSK